MNTFEARSKVQQSQPPLIEQFWSGDLLRSQNAIEELWSRPRSNRAYQRSDPHMSLACCVPYFMCLIKFKARVLQSIFRPVLCWGPLEGGVTWERKKPINIKNFGGTPPGVRPVCPGDTSHLSRDMSRLSGDILSLQYWFTHKSGPNVPGVPGTSRVCPWDASGASRPSNSCMWFFFIGFFLSIVTKTNVSNLLDCHKCDIPPLFPEAHPCSLRPKDWEKSQANENFERVRSKAFIGSGPNTVSESTVSNTELSEFFGAHWVPGSELSEFLSAYYLCVNANSPSYSQNSPSLPQNSVSSLLRNRTLETVFRPFPISFCGEFWRSRSRISREIEVFKRDWKFQAIFFSRFRPLGRHNQTAHENLLRVHALSP